LIPTTIFIVTARRLGQLMKTGSETIRCDAVPQTCYPLPGTAQRIGPVDNKLFSPLDPEHRRTSERRNTVVTSMNDGQADRTAADR